MAQDPAIPWATDLSHTMHIIIRRTAHYYPSIFKDINSAITTNNRDVVQNKQYRPGPPPHLGAELAYTGQAAR